MKAVLIIDSHLDLAWNALQWDRDLQLSAHTIRTLESRMAGRGRNRGTVGFPEMRQGRIALCFATLLARSTGTPEPGIDYRSPLQARAVARGQLEYYRGLEQQGAVRFVCTRDELDRHMLEWEAWDRQAAGNADEGDAPPFGFVISTEGADPILSPDRLEEWWGAGLRLLGLTHYGPGRYAGGTGTESGLTDLGVALLPELERLGILLDLTHCSDRAFWQALERYSGPVLASHNNCRALVPHQRQFSDEQLRALIDRYGVIGVALDNWMLKPGWVIGQSDPKQVVLEHALDHMDHICQLAGSSRHVALGTDLDGGFGAEQTPSDLDTIADLQKLPALMAQRGYQDDDITAILHGNWLRFLRQSWKR